MKKQISLAVFAILIAIFFLNEISSAQQTGVWTKTITWGSGTRKEVFNVPTTYNASKKYKLIVGLHGLHGDPTYYISFFGPMMGSNGNPDQSNNVCNSAVWVGHSPVQDNFIIACPQATGTNTDFWTPTSDTALITQIINDAKSMYNIDPDYIYLNGESLGGRAALRYGLLNYKRFRGLQLWVPAIQSMSEADNMASFNYSYSNSPHIPVTISLSSMDGLSYNDAEAYKQLYKAGCPVQLVEMNEYCHAPTPDNFTFNAIDFIDKNACTNVANDASINSITRPYSSECNTQFSPQVIIQNKGNGTLTSATINYQIDNGPVNTYNWIGSLSQLVRSIVTLPTLTVSAGQHTFKAYTSMPNGVADAVPSNDAVMVNFKAATASPATINIDFENERQAVSGIFQADWRGPAGWRQAATDPDLHWELDTMHSSYGTGGYCMLFNNTNVNGNGGQLSQSGNKYYFISPEYDFSNASAPMLSFDYAYQPITRSSILRTDSLAVYYSTDCGTTWKSLWVKGGVQLNTSGTTTWGTKENGEFFYPDAGDGFSVQDWASANVSLSQLSGMPNVTLAFVNISNEGEFIFLDKISLTGATSVAENISNDAINVYPNPSVDGSFNILSAESIKSMEVYNMQGEKIISQSLNVKQSSFSIDNASGIYLLKLKTENGEVIKKIVKE